MGLTHLDLAKLVEALYIAPRGVDWLYLSNPDANVYMGLTLRDRSLVCILRGSFDLEDWFHDVLARPIDPLGYPALRRVHEGFYGGTPEAADILELYREAGTNIVFAGHSLGAARALILAAEAKSRGLSVRGVVLWGEPAPMQAPGNAALEGIAGVSYRNVVDGVSDPVTKATTLLGYEHNYAMVNVESRPDSTLWDPLALHHFERYLSVTPEIEVPPHA